MRIGRLVDGRVSHQSPEQWAVPCRRLCRIRRTEGQKHGIQMKIGVAGEWCSALELQNQAGLDYAAVQWLMLLPERLG